MNSSIPRPADKLTHPTKADDASIPRSTADISHPAKANERKHPAQYH
ncbi:MAG: hypothetical protein MUC87_12935 [Bacteroidia bacterium]|nr:hypothetical protein [Bacteroidia bacterium]